MFYSQFFRAIQNFARCFLLVTLSLLSFSVFSIQPSPQQMEQFKRMSPAEQSRLAQQFGVAVPQAATRQAQVVEQKTTVASRDVPQAVSFQNVQKESGSTKEVVLKAFGYDLFAGKPTSFTPINDIPVSSDYVLGPGDSLKVNLYGKESQSYELAVDQEGMVYLPNLGPLSLAGLNFSEAKQTLIKTIDQKMIGVKVSVSMGQLRSIRVFVLGEAYQPGSYVVSSLSTITNALVLSGGVTTNGSLRTVQLKRRGKLVQTLDLYDLLLKGDTANDAQLKSGDVVFIPPVGLTVSIRGEVRRPAIYEINKNDTAEGLIQLAGGLLSTSHPKLSKVQRIGQDDKKLLLDADLSKLNTSFMLRNGDNVYIPATLGVLQNIVTLYGEVLRPGMQHWKEGGRLYDAIEKAGLTANTDMQYGLIKRYLKFNGDITLLSFSLSEIVENPKSKGNVHLQDQDEVILFGVHQFKRKNVIENIVSELRSQTSISSVSAEVSVSGNVRYPGVYPLVDGMQAKDLIKAAGGLTEKAFQLRAELSRSKFNEQQLRVDSRVDLNLSKSDSLGYILESRDRLQIKTKPNWSESEQVTLSGEIKFPGTYPIYKKDTLASLLERAGGLTEFAYAPGAIFTRVDLKKQQTDQLKEMQDRLAEDIAKAELVAANQNNESKSSGDVAEAQKLLSKLEGTAATGRLVIDLEKVLTKNLGYSIPLRSGDALVVPTKKNSVTIIGEVQIPISHVYESELEYWDYIQRSGGTTDKADEGRVYIIKANGAVKMPEGSSWFASNDYQVAPGDTVVVPLDADKLDQIVLWRDISQIFYQIALGAAAVGSL